MTQGLTFTATLEGQRFVKSTGAIRLTFDIPLTEAHLLPQIISLEGSLLQIAIVPEVKPEMDEWHG